MTGVADTHTTNPRDRSTGRPRQPEREELP